MLDVILKLNITSKQTTVVKFPQHLFQRHNLLELILFEWNIETMHFIHINKGTASKLKSKPFKSTHALVPSQNMQRSTHHHWWSKILHHLFLHLCFHINHLYCALFKPACDTMDDYNKAYRKELVTSLRILHKL